MTKAFALENDLKRHCPLNSFPLNVTRLTSVVSLTLSAVIDDAECHDSRSMTVLSWMCRKHRCAPNVGYCCFGALERVDSKVGDRCLFPQRKAINRVLDLIVFPAVGQHAVVLKDKQRDCHFVMVSKDCDFAHRPVPPDARRQVLPLRRGR